MSRALANLSERVNCFPLLAIGDRFVCQRFRGLITHAQFFEPQKTFLRHLPRFFAQVQLEVNLRKVEMAECEMISIAVTSQARRVAKKHFDGAAVFAAEVVQVGDVVIRLIAQQRHSVAFTQIPGFSGSSPATAGKSFRLMRHMAMLWRVMATRSQS